ncbi:MAG: plasmid maintenance system killer protein [Acidobacteria bacterium]|nr:plasmid maintenance system killer protein [Acidobacteriota bacterium]MYJ05113.1 plasmid maintenance system killer protein [Acidobacteriota bacterium]
MAILNAAPSLSTLSGLPSNCLESLKGSRAGQYSIRSNAQWRICFTWPAGSPGPTNVEIVDYHLLTRREDDAQANCSPRHRATR